MLSESTGASVLRILLAGFALVTVLLIVTAFVGIRGARSFEQNAFLLVEQQLLTYRLLSDLEREQSALNELSYELSQASPVANWDELLEELDDAQEDLLRIVREAGDSPDSQLWEQLGRATTQFSEHAREVIRARQATPESIRALFRSHELVLNRMTALVAAGAERASVTQARISQESLRELREMLVLLGVCVFLAIGFSFLTVRITTAAFRKMQWQANELNRVSWQMLETQEATARRFSHELHDELGQSLALLRSNLSETSGAEFVAQRRDILEVVDQAISNVRELSQLLRPVLLDDFGLDAALRWLTERFNERTGFDIHYESNLNRRLPDEVETHLFRITQEALTNAARHSCATRVKVHVKDSGTGVSLEIADNGVGLPRVPSPQPDESDERTPIRPRLGLVGMRARARQIGGTLDFHSPSSGGLTIVVTVPLASGSPQ